MPKSARADTPSHWYVPTNPGDDGIATPRLSAAVTKIAWTIVSSIPTERAVRYAPSAQVSHAATLRSAKLLRAGHAECWESPRARPA